MAWSVKALTDLPLITTFYHFILKEHPTNPKHFLRIPIRHSKYFYPTSHTSTVFQEHFETHQGRDSTWGSSQLTNRYCFKVSSWQSNISFKHILSTPFWHLHNTKPEWWDIWTAIKLRELRRGERDILTDGLLIWQDNSQLLIYHADVLREVTVGVWLITFRPAII